MDVYLLYVCAYTSSRTTIISRVRLVNHDSYSYHYHYHYHYNLLLLPLPLPVTWLIGSTRLKSDSDAA